MQTPLLVVFIFAAIVIHVICSYAVVHFGQQFYRHRFVKCPRPKVFDLAHKFLPNLSHQKALHVLYDIVAGILIVCPLLLNMAVFYLYWFLLVALRGIANVVTILPKDRDCEDAQYAGLKQFVVGHCYDKIYSGHFSIAVLFGILLWRTYPERVSLWMVLLALALYAYLILVTRAHYTIDLLVSVFAVLAVLHIRF